MLSGLTTGWAQNRSTIRVKTNGENTVTLPYQDSYLYAQFSPGVVHYRTGQPVNARLNYNLLLREIQFISPRGDTLALDQEHTIRQISLLGDTFIFDSNTGFIQVLGGDAPLRLAVSQYLQNAGIDKQGGYGQSTGVSSIKNLSSFSDNNSSISHLNMKGDVVYSLRKAYFLVDQNELTYAATRKRLIKLFPHQKKQIEEYLRQQPVQFDNQDDLQRLVVFCSNLL
jgi:hypothetical protein